MVLWQSWRLYHNGWSEHAPQAMMNSLIPLLNVVYDKVNDPESEPSYLTGLLDKISYFPTGDTYEPDDTYFQASIIYSDLPQAHSIIPATDIDWIAFHLNEESEVVIETSGPSGDTRMWLYDSNLTFYEYNDNSGVEDFSRIDRLCGVNALPADIYYVKIDENGNDNEIASYDVSLTVIPCTPKGSLTVTIYPEEVRGEARWRLTTGPDISWKTSGDTINNLPLGDYNLVFSEVAGWKQLDDRVITISEGSNSQSGTYYECVYFADDNLKDAVEEELGFSDPTTDDMLLLTYLNARNREITDLTGLGHAVNLTELDLYDNQLSSLPPEIGNLINLEYLNLDRNRLTSLPLEIGDLINLTEIYLFSNRLSSLPTEIGNLTNITRLVLGSNQLSSLPLEFWNLTNLIMLELGANNLSNLPPEIGNLTNLTELHLYSNQLSSLPPEIGNLTNLTWLVLDRNQLSILPNEIEYLTNLTLLYFHYNPLNTAAYCRILPLVEANNPGIDLRVDPNPNPITEDCSTDILDWALFTLHWLETDCGIPNNWCRGVDLNHFDDVNIGDFCEFARYWLAEPGN